MQLTKDYRGISKTRKTYSKLYTGGLHVYGDSAVIRTLHCGHIFGPTETQHTPTFLLIARRHNGRAFVEDINKNVVEKVLSNRLCRPLSAIK